MRIASVFLKLKRYLIGRDGAGLACFVGGCFFFSGVAGLVYEVLWVRLVDKVIGGAPFAVATVLAVFMGGLALGSYLAGKHIDRLAEKSALLALYGKFELGIAIWALVVPWLIQATLPVYRVLYDRLQDHFWCYQAAAFAGCSLVLMVPTALMGATLPVLCRFYVLRLDHLGTRTGRLYGINTVGAALGVVLCGFVLVEHLGVWKTLGLFAGLNAVVGLSCLVLSRFAAAGGVRRRQSSPKEPAEAKRTSAAHPTWQMHWAVVIFALSGFCAMAYEVLWTRLLGLMAGPTNYCFALVVATFIIGLALGSFLFSRPADRIRDPFGWLAATQMGAALSALAVSQLLGNGQVLFAKLIQTFQGRFSHLMLAQSLVLFTILLAPTLFLGAAFPLVNRLYVRSMDAMGRALGRAYALNTLGALAGSCVAGFVLIPWVGKQDGLRLIILIQFALAGLALARMGCGVQGATRRVPVLACILMAGLVLVSRYPCWQNSLLSRGWYRDFDAIEQDLARIGWAQALWNGSRLISRQRQGLAVVFQAEGVAGFTTVEREVTSLGTVEYALFNSGKADASSHGDRSTQTLSAHFPLLLHPHARKVMVLGLASGMTAGEVLLYPIEKLDIVEINEQVATACRRFFSPWNNQCLDDPRSRLIVQDGRNHLALTRETYDVIISEPSNPWMAGLANLYSLEFFRLARARLEVNGVFAQWIQAYEMDWETFAMLGRTFAAVFPHGALVKVGPVDYLLIGFRDAQSVDWATARNHLGFARQSKNVTFPGTNFLAHLILTEDLPALFGPGAMHTDNHPGIEFAAPRMLYRTGLNIDLAVADRRRLSPGTQALLAGHNRVETLLDLVEFAASANLPMFNVLPWAHLDPDQQSRYKHDVMDYCRRVLVPSYGIFQDPELKAGCADIQADAIREKLAEDDSHAADHYNLGLALAAAGRKEPAVRSLRRAVERDPAHEPALTALGLLLADGGKLDEAADLLAGAAVLAPGKVDPYKYLGMVELRRGALDVAVTHLSTALELAPGDPVVLGELGVALLRKGESRRAIACFTKALSGNPQDAVSQHYLELAKQQAGEEDEGTTEPLSTTMDADQPKLPDKLQEADSRQ